MYHGDIRLGETIDIKFTTRAFSTGAPTTLAGTPAISAYVGNGTTEITAGITLSVDFDSRTGLNNVRVVASGGNGFATATNVQLVITTGTVGGVSVVGEVIGTFSIECRSAVMPTTAGRTLDVSATGEAGVDWANVGSPTTTLGLTGTTIASTQKVDVETIKTNPVVNAGTVTFPTTATLASTTNITAGTITTTTNVTTVNGLAANVITAASINAAALNGKGDWNIGKTGYALSTAGAQAIWDALTSALTTASSIGKLLVDNINATISSRLASASYTAPLDASGTRTAVGLASANLDTQLSGINTKTTNLPASPAAVGSAMTLTSGERTSVADALLDRDMSVGTDSGSTTVRTPRQALRFSRNKWSISAGSLVVTKEDDATPSWSAAVTTTAGNPVSTVDPA